MFLRGWVVEPGAIAMTRGLTLLGAITEAGGFMFPANENRVSILREELGTGRRRVIRVDLSEIQRGDRPDVRVREGDIVEVGSAKGKLVLYGAYRLFVGLINVGLSLSPL